MEEATRINAPHLARWYSLDLAEWRECRVCGERFIIGTCTRGIGRRICPRCEEPLESLASQMIGIEEAAEIIANARAERLDLSRGAG